MRRLVRFVLLLLCAISLLSALVPAATATAASGTWVNTGGSNWQYTVNGTALTGWQKIGGRWYLFDASGNMLRGWQANGGRWYFLAQSGAMATGWQKDKGKWYYLGSSGAMQTGWIKPGSSWYYLKSSGEMATGWMTVGSKSYYFYSSGTMAVSTTVGGYKINSYGEWEPNNEKEYPARGSYTPGSVYGVNLNQTELNQVRAKVKQIAGKYINANMSEYDKALTMYNELLVNCSYAPDWSKNRANTAWGALIYRQAQCSGYARAYKALLDEVGIYCHYVHSNNGSHQWNIIKLDGSWYIVDTTNGSYNVTWAFFLVKDKDYVRLGETWDKNKYPAATKNHPRNDTSWFWDNLIVE